MTQLGGIDWVAIQRALQRWVVGGSGLPSSSVYWGQQDSPRVAEPAIELRIYNQTQLGQAWLDRESNLLQVPALGVSAVDPTLDTLTIAGHGLITGDGPVRLAIAPTMPGSLSFPLAATGSMPDGLLEGVDYWVVVLDGDTIQLSATYFGTGGNFVGNPIMTLDIQSAGVGTITLFGNTHTRRAGQELLYIARAMERCTLNLECHTSAAVGMGMAMSVLHGVNARRMLPSQQAILAAANIGVQDVERVRAIHGVRNAVMFEPRASLQVYFSIVSEASETGTIIQRATGTLLNGDPFVIT